MALIERLDVTTKATHWKGAIPMNYIYTAGRAGDEFLRRLRDKGELSGTACAACGVVYVPPKTFCERCFARIEADVVPVKARGVVRTFTVCHETYDGKEKAAPSVLALIGLEGATGGLIHRLGEVDPAKVRIGMTVEAVLKPKKEREGSILDIKHFKPA